MIYNAKINSSGHIKSFGHGDTYSWVIWVIIGLGNNLWPCSTKPLPISMLKIKQRWFKSKELLETKSVKFSTPTVSINKLCFILSAILFRPQRVTRQLHSPSLVAIRLSVGYETWPPIGRHHPLWLVGLNIDWDYLLPHCIMGSCYQWEFPLFFQTPGKCLPLGLCKGTVNQSSVWPEPTMTHFSDTYMHYQALIS